MKTILLAALHLALPAAAVAAEDSPLTVDAGLGYARPQGAFATYADVVDVSGNHLASSERATFPFSAAPSLAIGCGGGGGDLRLSGWWYAHRESSSITTSTASERIAPVGFYNVGSFGTGTAGASSRLRAAVVDLTVGGHGRVGDGPVSLAPRVGLRYLDLSARQDSHYELSAGNYAFSDHSRSWALGPVAEGALRWGFGAARAVGLSVHGSGALLRAQTSAEHGLRTGATNSASEIENGSQVATMLSFGLALDWRAWRQLDVSLAYDFSQWTRVLDQASHTGPAGSRETTGDISWDIATLRIAYGF